MQILIFQRYLWQLKRLHHHVAMVSFIKKKKSTDPSFDGACTPNEHIVWPSERHCPTPQVTSADPAATMRRAAVLSVPAENYQAYYRSSFRMNLRNLSIDRPTYMEIWWTSWCIVHGRCRSLVVCNLWLLGMLYEPVVYSSTLYPVAFSFCTNPHCTLTFSSIHSDLEPIPPGLQCSSLSRCWAFTTPSLLGIVVPQ